MSESDSNKKRPSWDEYFLELVDTISKRATCDRGKAACVIVKDKRIVATGYVGSPPGMPHCDEAGHLFSKVIDEEGGVKEHCIRTVHAEQNAICQAAKYGIPLEGATVYANMTPCFVCAKLLVSLGIKRIICKKDYHASKLSKELLEAAGVALEIKDASTVKYERQ